MRLRESAPGAELCVTGVLLPPAAAFRLNERGIRLGIAHISQQAAFHGRVITVFMNGGARCMSWQRAGRPAGPHVQQHPTAAPRGPRVGEHRSCPAQQRRSRRVCPGATGGEPSLRCPWTHPGSADGPAHQASYPAAAVKADLMNRPGGGDPVGVCEGYSPASRPLRSWVALREWWMRPPRLVRVP